MAVSENFAMYLNAFATWEDALADMARSNVAKPAFGVAAALMRRHASPLTVIQDRTLDDVAEDEVGIPTVNGNFAHYLNGFDTWDEVRADLPRHTKAPAALELVDRLADAYERPAGVLHHQGARLDRSF